MNTKTQALILKYIPKRTIESFTAKQLKVIGNYPSQKKLRAVCRWRLRLAKLDRTSQELAKECKTHISLVSRWTHFNVVPSDDSFNKVQAVLDQWESA